MQFRNSVYDVDKNGNVFNTKLKKQITPVLKKTGYYEVRLGLNNKRTSLSHHRVVWETWNGSIPQGMHINHINQIKSDNRLSNLEMVTPSENQQKRELACGEEIHNSKATDTIVREIRNSVESTSVLAEKYDLSKSAVKRIKNYTTWKHVS